MRVSPAVTLLSVFFIVAGAAHFLSPAAYLQIMPPLLPAPRALVYVSGAAEIAGGLGLLFARTRRLAGLGLALLLVAVFPANVYAAGHGMKIFGADVPRWLLLARLPLQALLLVWVYFVSWKPGKLPA